MILFCPTLQTVKIILFDKKLKLFSYGKFNIISFYQKDHGPRDSSSLKDWVVDNLKKSQDIYQFIGGHYAADVNGNVYKKNLLVGNYNNFTNTHSMQS